MAERLRASADADEATLRSAMSRAYYAALHASNALFPEQPLSERRSNESSHQFIIRRALEYAQDRRNPLADSAALLVDRLNKGRRERNWADYELHARLLPHQVNEMFKRVNAVLSICAEIEAAAGSADDARNGSAG